MARLSVTLDDEVYEELASIADPEEIKRLIESVLTITERIRADQFQPWLGLVRDSLAHVGSTGSASGVAREAVDVFLRLLKEAKRVAQLETGYEALSQDEERNRIMAKASRRASGRWADEP